MGRRGNFTPKQPHQYKFCKTAPRLVSLSDACAMRDGGVVSRGMLAGGTMDAGWCWESCSEAGEVQGGGHASSLAGFSLFAGPQTLGCAGVAGEFGWCLAGLG